VSEVSPDGEVMGKLNFTASLGEQLHCAGCPASAQLHQQKKSIHIRFTPCVCALSACYKGLGIAHLRLTTQLSAKLSEGERVAVKSAQTQVHAYPFSLPKEGFLFVSFIIQRRYFFVFVASYHVTSRHIKLLHNNIEEISLYITSYLVIYRHFFSSDRNS